MKVTQIAKTASAAAVSLAMMLSLAACGGSDTAAESTDDGKEMTIDVFSSTANIQGVQTGWFAKLVKDKFNLKLNLIAPNVAGGDTLFETRSAAGNLGDIVITGTGNGRLEKLVKSKLITDMTPYIKDAKNIKRFQSAVDHVTEVAGADGVWGIPSAVSSQPATEPSEGDEPAAAPYIRWDYYREIGYPEIKDFDDFLDVMKQMQDKARADTGQDDIYALSLFGDWDGAMMQNAQAIASWLGYGTVNSVLTKADGSDDQSILKEGGVYEQVLKFLNEAQRMGLVDPESSTQTWDNLSTKTTEGKVLVSLWSWLGQPRQNTPANKEKGVGFMLAPLQSMEIYSDGFTPMGIDPVISLGSKAKNKQRLVNFIDWLYSPEGVYAQASNAGGSVCPEDLCWTSTDEGNELTEFGQKAMNDSDGLEVPEDWGGSEYNKGVSSLNMKMVAQNDIDPNTDETYNSALWKTELAKSNKLRDDWSSHMDGALNSIEYLQKTNKLLVAAGASYVAPAEDSTISTVRSQIQTEVKNGSWQAVFAKDEAEFDSKLQTMRDTVNGLGYDQVEKLDMENAQAQNEARAAISKE